ncbi:MAG: hypothetical protein FWF91_04340 [Coriobacteriia bacterium]|nr:hypothetical protein [Coriobacteriia bacterium]
MATTRTVITPGKRRPGRPSSGEDLVPVCITLRREQVEWLRTYLDNRRFKGGLSSSSAIIRSLIDSVFAPRGEVEQHPL